MSGGLGLILQKAKWNLLQTDSMSITGDGYLIAHDLMEHRKLNEIGGIGEELKAFGGLYLVRGWTNSIRKDDYRPTYEHIASDVQNFYEKYTSCGFGMNVPKTIACHDTDFEYFIKDTIDEARKQTKDNSKYSEEPLDHNEMNQYLSDVVHFLRSGFRRMKRKYRNETQNELYSQFMEIAETINRAIDSGTPSYIKNEFPYVEGQELLLTYGNGTAYLEEYFQEW